ncbi:MAG: VOC family protein [Pseudomonadota bacterium]
MSFQPSNAVVWAEIHVRDLDAGEAFYARVTGMDAMRTEMFGANVAIFGGQEGSGFDLQAGEPAQGGSIVYIAAKGKLADTLQRVWDAGGEVVGEPQQIPSGQFAVCKDPDGNAIGFYEAAA